MASDSPVISVKFEKGYPIRKFFEFLNGYHSQIGLIFERNEIRSQLMNLDSHVYNDFVLERSNITDYRYNSEEPRVVAGANLKELSNELKKIQKNDGVTFCLFGTEYLSIYRHSSKTGEQNGVANVRLISIALNNYEIPEIRTKNDPTCTVTSQSFKEECAGIVNTDTKLSYIIGLQQGVVFNNFDAATSVCAYTGRLGNCTGFEGVSIPGMVKLPATNGLPRSQLNIVTKIEEIRIQVHTAKFKNLAKLTAITDGNVKIYMGNKHPYAVFVTDVGPYGKLNTILFDVNAALNIE
jgi:hypothetical protein